MAESEHNDTITIREIEYTISITHKESTSHDLCELLRLELTRFGNARKKVETTENPIRDFLKANIENSIELRNNSKVCFLNYSEHGSLSLVFTMLVITDSNYGYSLQALDYFIKNTIGGYLEELLERHLPVSISVHESSNSSVIKSEYKTAKTGSVISANRDYLSIILSALALLIALGLSVIWLFQSKSEPEYLKPEVQFQLQELDSLLEKKVKQSLERERESSQNRERIAPYSIQNTNSLKKK